MKNEICISLLENPGDLKLDRLTWKTLFQGRPTGP